MTNIKRCIKALIVFAISSISILSMASNFSIADNKIVFDGNNYTYIVLFAVYVYFIKKIMFTHNKRLNIVSGITSIIITAIYILSYVTSKFLLSGYMPESRTYFIFIATKCLACWITFFLIIKMFFENAEKRAGVNINSNANKKINSKGNKIKNFFTDNKKSIVSVALLLFIAYIPYIIDSFPGNITYDFAIQVRQALKYEQIVNHHPYMTTEIIAICLKLGKLIGSYTTGFFIYTIIQCILSCLVFSGCIYYMAKRNVSIKFRIITLLFFMILPIFGYYTVWLTKDIIFTLFITLITIGITEICHDKQILNSKKYILFMIVSMLLSMIFRKNGFYVIAIMMPICLIQNFRKWKQILIIFCIPIILFKVIDGPVRTKLQIPDGSKLEMLSIPAQQMARIYTYDKERLTYDQKEKIEKYINDENINYLYDPLLSDPVKGKLNSAEIEKDKVGFFKFIMELSLKYPARTAESFLCTTYRFYYLNNEIARGVGGYKPQSVYVIDNMLPEDMNVKSNINNVKLLEKLDDIIYKNKMPIFSTLMASGIYISANIVFIGYLIYKRKYRYITAFLPVFLVLLTQLAGPVVDERYMYSAFTCFPILASTAIYISNYNKSNDKEGND